MNHFACQKGERGLAAMEQNVLGGLARLRITSTVEVECESPGQST